MAAGLPLLAKFQSRLTTNPLINSEQSFVFRSPIRLFGSKRNVDGSLRKLPSELQLSGVGSAKSQMLCSELYLVNDLARLACQRGVAFGYLDIGWANYIR